MILSEDRQIRLAHVITDQIWDDDLVEYSDESQAIKLAKKAVLEFMAEEEELDKKATEKVTMFYVQLTLNFDELISKNTLVSIKVSEALATCAYG